MPLTDWMEDCHCVSCRFAAGWLRTAVELRVTHANIIDHNRYSWELLSRNSIMYKLWSPPLALVSQPCNLQTSVLAVTPLNSVQREVKIILSMRSSAAEVT